MDAHNAIIVFQGKNIRRVWHNDEWWFVIEDIVTILTDSRDPKQYINKMRQRDSILSEGWVQIVHTLSVPTVGGQQKMNCVNTEGAFRIVQSIPSQKAEPFKLWLAKVGYDRVKEIENPELAQQRMKEIYKAKGYSEDWVEKRVRGIAVRAELTDEWEKRGVHTNKDYSILTTEISQATFGMTPTEYKQFKGLKTENLRDHMDDMELILTMLGEATTTRLTQDRDSQQFGELKKDAKDGGGVAGAARKNIEQQLGKSVVTSTNYLDKPEKVKTLPKKAKG
jgi:hypothetical protein